jgi:glyoxylase-like metal-dependent hydrolase (beta-lactamase superfamily II)
MGERGFRIAALLAFFSTAAMSQDSGNVVDAVARTIGAPTVKSIQYSGSGYIFGFGQSYQPGGPWVKFNLKSYSQLADYDRGASREENVRTYLDPPERGGTAVFIGELRQVAFLNGDAAWNAGPGNAPTPAPAALETRQLQLAISPHGFVKAAMAASPTVASRTVDGKRVTVVSFTWKGKYKVNGYVNGQNLLEKVETWMPDPLLGDMLIENSFSDYRDFSGVKFPGKIVQKQGGFPVLDLSVTDVQPNAASSLDVPEAARQPVAPVSRVDTLKVADGVWLLVAPVGPNSMAVEFKDYVAIVEAPFSEERSLAVIAEVKKLVANKPIRYLINTHHHFDHSSGIRTYVAEGVTIITHRINTAFYNQVFRLPHTLSPDKLSLNRKPARFETSTEKHVLTDGSRSLELHLLQGNPHNPGLFLVYLRKEKLLYQADSFTAPPPGAPLRPAVNMVNTRNVNLMENIERLRLDVEQILAAHGRVMPIADLRKAVGRAD